MAPPVTTLPAPTQHTTPAPTVSGWPGKFVQDLQAPLANPWSSKEGFIELASRAGVIALVLIPVALVGYYLFRRWTTESSPSEPSTKPTAIPSRLQSVLSPPKSPYKPPRSVKELSEAELKSRLTPVKRTLVSSSTPAPSPSISSDPISPAAKSDEEIIQEAADQIALAYYDWTNNLHLLGSEERVASFEQQCSQFFETFPETSLNSKYRKTVNQHWMRFSYLQINYEFLWFHYIAGREGFLFNALIEGLKVYFAAEPSKPLPYHAKNAVGLAIHLNKEMKSMIQKDPDLQELTNSAINAAIIALEADLHREEDELLKNTASKRTGFVDLTKKRQRLDLLKYDSASSTYPTYFEFNDKELKKTGSLNKIYVFCKLFPKIKVEILTSGEPICFNPEGTFTITLGQGDQNQFVYVIQ